MPPHAVDPDRLAHLEAEGWKAYYDRNWPRAFWLLVTLLREQFGFGWGDALRGAYWIVRASIAFAPLWDSKPAVARRFLARFYRVARRTTGATFDPERVADLELRYWIVHRAIVAQDDHTPLVTALQNLHVALFGLTLEAALPSAEHRARAAAIVDGITNDWSKDIPGDWLRLEAALREAYRDAQSRARV